MNLKPISLGRGNWSRGAGTHGYKDSNGCYEGSLSFISLFSFIECHPRPSQRAPYLHPTSKNPVKSYKRVSTYLSQNTYTPLSPHICIFTAICTVSSTFNSLISPTIYPFAACWPTRSVQGLIPLLFSQRVTESQLFIVGGLHTLIHVY